MDVSEFSANYVHLSDAELLCLWADRTTLVPNAALALDNELQRRGLDKQKATRIKKRLDALAAREEKGPIANQVAAMKYERSMRRFVGWEEPEFHSPYSGRDPRNTFAYFRHKYRVWRAFREHTGHWPVFSIWFHFASGIAVFGFAIAAFIWAAERTRQGWWTIVAAIASVIVLMELRELGARLMRKLDWKMYGM